jgi:hypothetical protein
LSFSCGFVSGFIASDTSKIADSAFEHKQKVADSAFVFGGDIRHGTSRGWTTAMSGGVQFALGFFALMSVPALMRSVDNPSGTSG